MKKLLLRLAIWPALFMSLVVNAQTGGVEGKVTDQGGEALPGASIRVKGTDTGTVSDIEGRYTIASGLTDESILIFSFIGAVTQEVQVQGRSVIDISLADDVVSLEEIVVVGYGTQQKKDVTGSVSLVDSEEFANRPNTQFGNLLQGKAAGVQVLSSSGKPSQGFSIRIRGTNSINASSEPLYLLDGVPTNDTRSINPADIESISVLKDASSAAIYGSQAANGVVIITTKKGTSDKPTINFNSYAGYSEVSNTLDVLNGQQYQDLMIDLGQTTDWSLYTENTDWQDEIFQRGVSQSHQVSVSGKMPTSNYYISGGWTQQRGVVRSAEMERTNFKINFEQELSDWLSMGTRIAYTGYSDVDVTDNTSVNSGGVLLGALNTPSVIGIYNADGTFTSNPFQNWENPIAQTDGTDKKFRSQRILGNIYLNVEFLENFNFKSNIGVDQDNDVFDSFLDPFRTSFGRALNGQATNNRNRNSYRIIENTLTYNKTIDSHNFQILVGNILQKWNWEGSSIQTRGFASANIPTTNGGSEINSASGWRAEKANTSYIGRLNYSYKDKYLLTANFRADGSSIFGPQNRWGFFPSFSLGWRLSEEAFFDNSGFINDLKLRAGWGIVGNDQITNYAFFGRVGLGANYPIGGVALPGSFPASIENQTLKWEESKQTNLGLDISLLEGRVDVVVDAYVKNTVDLLLNAPLPRTTGFDNAVQNIGELRNKGLEFYITGVVLDKEVRWSSNLNLSINRNEVVNIVGQELFQGGIAGRGEASLAREGLPLGSLYGYVYAGVNPGTGHAVYLNSEGERTISPTADDRVIIGDPNPDFIYGFTNNIEYKGFSLTVFFQGSQGNDILNASRIDTEGMTDPKNQSTAVLDRWQQPGDVTNIPAASWGNADNSRISTRFIEDGSYLRLKTLSLGYQLPSSLTSKFDIQSMRIYATGENLLTFTNYSGFDPEVNAFGSSNTVQGIDYGTYPQSRNIIFGLNVTF